MCKKTQSNKRTQLESSRCSPQKELLLSFHKYRTDPVANHNAHLNRSMLIVAKISDQHQIYYYPVVLTMFGTHSSIANLWYLYNIMFIYPKAIRQVHFDNFFSENFAKGFFGKNTYRIQRGLREFHCTPRTFSKIFCS